MATRAKYFRVRQEDKKQDKPDTDIIMKFSPSYGRYVTRALTLFFGEGKNFVTIKAADRLMDRALWVAEVLRKRVPDLHQIVEIKERQVVDVYQPREQGLVKVQQKRYLTIIQVVLTKTPTPEQKKSVGYHAPLQGKVEQYLTKQKWQKQQAERKQRIQNRGERRREGGGNNKRDRQNQNEGDRRRDNRDNRENRGGQRTRGGRRN